MKLTRHNGRTGKNGVYNPKHNDRRFDVENSEHIDVQRVRKNIYWDCYQGFSGEVVGIEKQKYSFEEVERLYYFEHYTEYVQAQNGRNEKARHTERNRTIEDLLKNNKTCPEESIYQIGTIEESVSGETLALITTEFFAEMEQRYGEHFHILDWALHVDEGTPHIHERHVFDCKNRYGELCPQQEKALEQMGIELPYSDKAKGKNNNRKQSFDRECRELLFKVCQRNGLQLDEIPSYGGRAYLEKQDYILEKQKLKLLETRKIIAEKKCQIEQKEHELEELVLKIEDAEEIIAETAEKAYEKACETVAVTVGKQIRQEDIRAIEEYAAWLIKPERKASKDYRDYAVKQLKKMIEKISEKRLKKPEHKKENVEQIKKVARQSFKEKLQEKIAEVEIREAARKQSAILSDRKEHMEL